MLYRGCVLLLSLAALLAAESRTSRFHRILRMYTDPVYSDTRRNFTGYVNYSRNQVEFGPDTSLPLTNRSESTDEIVQLTNDSRLNSFRFRGDTTRTSSLEFRIGVDGNYRRESLVRTYETLGMTDTSGSLQKYGRFYAEGSWSVARYPIAQGRLKRLFMGGNIRVRSDATRQGSSFHRNGTLSETKSLDQTGAIECAPKIGWGRPLPITPLYQAFEIERMLREERLISADLKEETILQLAQLIATKDLRDRRYHRPSKFFSRELDSVLKADSSYLHHPSSYAVVRLREVTDISKRPLFSGPLLEISARGEIEARSLTRTYDGELNVHRSYTSPFLESRYSLLNFKAQYGWAITDRLFLSGDLSGFVPELTDYDDLPESQLNLGVDARFYAYACYWIADRLTLDLSISGLSTKYLVVPKDWPGYVGAGLTYRIEDNILLSLTFDHFYQKPSRSGISGERVSFKKTNSQFLGVSLLYEL